MDGLREEPQSGSDAGHQPVEMSKLRRAERHVSRTMLSGLFLMIPMLITGLILWLFIVYLDRPFRGEDGFFTRWIEGTHLDFLGVGIIFTVVVLYLVGLLASRGAGRRVIHWPTAVLSRVPVVKSIYSVAKQATEALSSPAGHQYSRVVFLEWPRAGFSALGFVTGHFHSVADQRTYLVVYIPTVPNPTSGNLAFVSEEDVTETNLTVEDAMKLVFSGGIVLPEVLSVRPEASLSEPPRTRASRQRPA